VRGLVGDLEEVNTWGNRAEVGSSGTGKRVRIGICRGKGGQSGVEGDG